jgi:TPP-dependent indolepyruvate ferredoxin oxidoreductase alpha subunit
VVTEQERRVVTEQERRVVTEQERRVNCMGKDEGSLVGEGISRGGLG